MENQIEYSIPDIIMQEMPQEIQDHINGVRREKKQLGGKMYDKGEYESILTSLER